ncbi:AI-2E family transporter [Clostridium polynesiense]|uniref:AI-2E family transporter n=1 Tax=Clostridium polynesiense TaxID=1325933 RepID=UPI000694623E|nr:AI-2E family transporter [Clostridium polynesiense]
MKHLNDPKFSSKILLATYIVFLAFILLNIKAVGRFFGGLMGILTPFIIGAGIAFVVNIPMKLIEENIMQPLLKRSKKKGIIRPISLLSTLIIIMGLIVALFLYVIPQLVQSSSTLMQNIPQYVSSLEGFMNEYMSSTELLNEIWVKVLSMGENILKVVGQITGGLMNQLLGITLGVTSVIFNIIMGLLISVYILLSKEKLILQAKKILFAFIEIDKAREVMEIARLSQLKFSKFVSGQFIEAIILGLLCFIGMTIFSMPYAVLISTLVGVTALIPIFGALIGTIPGAFIILMVNPAKAIWFIVLIIVIQQIEGNLIYPIVVGNSIGLSALWVLLAITVGGGYFGVLGMLIGIPLLGVIYTVFSRAVNDRLKKKGINMERER